jgi:ABC-2 type transport system permease protein
MNPGVIRTLVAKDFALFFRNRFYAYITVLGLVFYLVIYFVLPSSVEEDLELALHAPVIPPVFEMLLAEEAGLTVTELDSEEALKEAVTNGDYYIGIDLPADIMEQFAAGEKPQITLYFSAGAPGEIYSAVETMIRELSYMQTGQPLALELSTEVLGQDMLGDQVPLRDRMRVLLALTIIMFEMMGLASLITEEVEQGTIRALLVTPMSTRDLFAAKLIMGVGLSFIQGILFMAIVGGFSHQALIVALAILLGSALFTGSGFLIASLSRDMLSSMGWGILMLVIFIIPSFGIIFPGVTSNWVQAIPSYYLADTVHQASNFGAGWGHNWSNLLILLTWDVAIISAGILALKRRFQ